MILRQAISHQCSVGGDTPISTPDRSFPSRFHTHAVILLLWTLFTAPAFPWTGSDDVPSGWCRVLVSSNIRGARILIDGHDYGRTWLAVELGCGEHRVRIESEGYIPFERIFFLQPGSSVSVQEKLKPLGAMPRVPANALPTPKAMPAQPAVVCPITDEGTDEGAESTDGPAPTSFAHWLREYQKQALQCGVSPAVTDSAFRGVVPLGKLLAYDRKQAEYSKTFFAYLNGRVTAGLVAAGRSRVRQHQTLLGGLEDRYGVPAEVLVALWGLESGYGSGMGSTPVISALSTLAYDGRRRGFYRRELLSALRILERESLEPGRMLGSWAGAMGQPQFMPSTYLRWGLDADGDGRVDIWKSVADALESAANYLAGIGWQRGQPWGVEVLLPPGFVAYQARLSLEQGNDAWSSLGVRLANGRSLPSSPATGSIILPAGIQGPAFLVYDNFRVITEWNKSLFYALSAGHLADRLAGKGGLVGKPPPGDKSLRTSAIRAMQADLNALGFPAGEPDGMVGMQTRQALRDYQRSRDLTADAYPRPALVVRLHREAGAGQGGGREGLGSGDIRRLQELLHSLGYPVGEPDGIMGPATRKAMRAYLRDRGLPVVEEPTPEIIRRLALESEH